MSGNTAPVNAVKEAEAKKRHDAHQEAQADPHREVLTPKSSRTIQRLPGTKSSRRWRPTASRRGAGRQDPGAAKGRGIM